MAVEGKAALEAKGVASAQAAGNYAKLFSRIQNFVPHPGTGRFIGGNVNLKTIFRGISGAANQDVAQAADRSTRDPVKLHRAEVRVRELLEQVDAFRTLNRNLREIVGEVFDAAIELAGIITHPAEIFFARAGIDHEQIIVLAKAVNDHVVDESSLGIEQRRILCLPDRQACSIVHRDVLDGVERPGAAEPNVAHMADVKDADAGADCHVLGDNATTDGRRIFDRHIPAVEFDHFGAQSAMHSVQRCLADYGRSGLHNRQY